MTAKSNASMFVHTSSEVITYNSNTPITLRLDDDDDDDDDDYDDDADDEIKTSNYKSQNKLFVFKKHLLFKKNNFISNNF